MKLHSKKKYFECKECDGIFCRKDLLNKHKLKHKEEKPYKCNLCIKSFSDNSNLNIHYKIHVIIILLYY